MSPQMRGVVGRADVTVPILWMKDGGLRGQRLDLVWVKCTSGQRAGQRMVVSAALIGLLLAPCSQALNNTPSSLSSSQVQAIYSLTQEGNKDGGGH